MTVTFRCGKCHKEVKADDSTAGKRGKCPFCGESSYIPMKVSEEEVIPLSPLDEEAERDREKEIESLMVQERELIHELGGGPEMPLEHKDDLSSEDLHHFVVNFCMDMYNGRLDRAERHVREMKKLKFTALEAVEDFRSGKATEMVLDVIPKRVLKGFLAELRDKLR